METELAQIAKELRAISKRELGQWLRRGELLTKAREMTTDTYFRTWTRKLGLSKTTVYKSMAAWRDFGASPVAGQFTIEAMALLAQSPEAREEAITLAASTKITPKLARQILSRHLPTERAIAAPTLAATQRAGYFETFDIDGFTVTLAGPGNPTASDLLGVIMHVQRQLRDRMTRAA